MGSTFTMGAAGFSGPETRKWFPDAVARVAGAVDEASIGGFAGSRGNPCPPGFGEMAIRPERTVTGREIPELR